MKKKLLLILVASCVCLTGALATPKQNVKKHAISQEMMLDRFLNYVGVESASAKPKGDEYPMTEGQKQMAELLKKDAEALNAQVTLSEWGYVYVSIPSNINYPVPTIGITCHLDYTPEVAGVGIKPTVLKYTGGVINLGHGTLDPSAVSGVDLPNLVGKTIIHTDGTTILGADDKNGCTIAMSIIETVQKEGFKHGPLQFVFCPNEDIGLAALKIDTTLFNPDIVIDVDGGGCTQVAVSNFTAYGIKLKFTGNDVHPAEAKKFHLGDALAAAATYIAGVPLQYRPEHTEGKQGYIHPYSIEQLPNTEDNPNPSYIIDTRVRYFDKEEGALFNRIIKENLEHISQSFPYVQVEILNEGIQYDNVEYTMHPQSIPLLQKAAARCQKNIELVDLRAGTTAAMFCAKGLRGGIGMFSGQHNEHSLLEYSVLEEMYEAYIMLLTIIDEAIR